jgi:hypothetical protein
LSFELKNKIPRSKLQGMLNKSSPPIRSRANIG